MTFFHCNRPFFHVGHFFSGHFVPEDTLSCWTSKGCLLPKIFCPRGCFIPHHSSFCLRLFCLRLFVSGRFLPKDFMSQDVLSMYRIYGFNETVIINYVDKNNLIKITKVRNTLHFTISFDGK